MGFWDWLRPRNVDKDKTNQHKSADPKLTQAFKRVKQDIQKLDAALVGINSTLTQHTTILEKQNTILDGHTSRMGKLEEMISASSTVPSSADYPINRPIEATNRLLEPTNRLIATKPEAAKNAIDLDLQAYSLQEKKILEVFLSHRDMALSYLDIAKVLNKSPHTVKNQLRQMNMKIDLFDKMVDRENKNRFKLKKHLKIKTSLDAD